MTNQEREEILSKVGLNLEYINRKFSFRGFSSEEWSKVSIHWRVIQSVLPLKYKICPICGYIGSSYFIRHLSTHNLLPKDWYNQYHQIETPHCICGNELELKVNQSWEYPTYCSHSCCMIHKNEVYGHNFSKHLTPEQRKANGLTDDSKYAEYLLQISKSAKLRLKRRNSKYGSPFAIRLTPEQRLANNITTEEQYKAYQNKVKRRRIETSRKAGVSCVKRYGCNLKGRSFKSVLIYNGNSYKLDSSHELWTLLWIIDNKVGNVIDTQHYYQNDTIAYNKKGAISDIRVLVNGSIINFEVHKDDDLENIKRKKYCTELHGDKFELVTLDQAWSYFEELLSKGFLLWKVFDDLSASNKNKTPLVIKYENIPRKDKS